MNRVLSPANLWQELRRRRVVKVVIAYGAAALVLIEAANNILPPFGVPDSINRVLVAIALLGLPIAIFLAWKFDVVADPGSTASAGATTGSEDLPADRVAVLPFEDLSEHKGDQYFADGVAEDIISRLARIPTFSVVSRTSVMGFRGAQKSIPAIARQLGAGSILEGSVRRAAGRARVVAQLIDANNDRTIWTETYDRDVDDLFSVQSEIAASVAHGLRASLSAEVEARLATVRRGDPEAYDLYLKAKYLWNRRSVSGLRESRALLDHAIVRDPELALAHAGLATTLATAALYDLDAPPEIMPRALEAAHCALRLEPDLVEALNARGLIECIWHWDWAGGAQTFKHAARVSPSDAVARQWYAMNCLAPQGRLVEAQEALDEARRLDPLSQVLRASEGVLKYLQRDVEGAEAALMSLVGEADCLPVAHLFMGLVQELAGRHEQARSSFRAAESAGGRTVEALAALATNKAMDGDVPGAERLLDQMVAISERQYVSPGRLAQVYAAIGDWVRAGEQWSEAVKIRSGDLIWVGVSPVYDFARDRPELQAVVKAVGAVRQTITPD